MLGKTIEEVSLHKNDVPKLFGLYLIRGKMEGEYVLRHKSGTPIPIRYRAFVFPDGCNAAIWEPLTDWRGLYLAALLELDSTKLRGRMDIALAAVHHQLDKSSDPDQNQTLRDALSALQACSETLAEACPLSGQFVRPCTKRRPHKMYITQFVYHTV